MTCIRCGIEHDGEPMREWFAKRGKDPSGIKLCAACVVQALSDLVEEAGDGCPGRGSCHGAQKWCDECGDVATVCDWSTCDVHARTSLPKETGR